MFPHRRLGDAMCGGRGAEPTCVRPRPHGLCERACVPAAPRTLTCVFASWASWRGPQRCRLVASCAGGPFLSCFSQRLRRGREQRLTYVSSDTLKEAHLLEELLLETISPRKNHKLHRTFTPPVFARPRVGTPTPWENSECFLVWAECFLVLPLSTQRAP